MEAMKERKEQMEKLEKLVDAKDPMGTKAREVLGQAIITTAAAQSDCAQLKSGSDISYSRKVEEPEDVLAYSRAVRHKDSLLE